MRITTPKDMTSFIKDLFDLELDADVDMDRSDINMVSPLRSDDGDLSPVALDVRTENGARFTVVVMPHKDNAK